MKVCYVDESGNSGEDRCLVMVGIVVDATRLSRTREEFAEVFEAVQGLFDENLRELKGTKMIFGRDRWRKVDPGARKQIAEFFCGWIADRKHRLAVAAIDREQFAREANGQFAAVCGDPWLAASLHIALQIQKAHQGTDHNKGHTFLFVDENKKGADALAELLFSPPPWTDAYYERQPKQERLDQIIDSAFAVKSHHAGLVQVADIYALILRRFAEFRDFGSTELWQGERELIEHYATILAPRMLPISTRWPKRPTCECCDWYNRLAPPLLRRLGS